VTDIGRRLLRGGLTAAIGRSLIALGVVLVNAMVARLLSPADTGIFLLALSIVTVAAVLADFGFGKTLLRVIPDAMVNDDPDRALTQIRTVLLAGLITGMVTALLLASPAGVWIADRLSRGGVLGALMPLVALWLLATLFSSLLAETCRGFHQIGAAILFGGAMNGLGNILIVGGLLSLAWLMAVPVSLNDILWLFIASGTVIIILAAMRLRARFNRSGIRSGVDSLTGVFRMAWPFWLSNAAMITLVQSEIWILGLLRPPEEVAAFGLVSRLAVLVSFPLVIVNSMLPPLISELHASGQKERMERMLRGAAGLTTLLALLAFIVLLFAGDPLSRFLFGAYYGGNHAIMMTLSIGWLFHVWAGSGGFVLSMTDNQHTMMRITLVVAALTIALGLGLTSRYGGLGMAVAATTGLVLQNVLMLWFIRRNIGIRIHAGVAGIRDVWQQMTQRIGRR